MTEKTELKKELLSVKEAGFVLNLSPWTIFRMIYDGRIESVRLGGRRLIRRRDVEKAIEVGLPSVQQQ